MIEGQAEGITDTGIVLGWARDPESPAPCLVQLRLQGGQVVAEALADRFRGDLLEASKGHGHHGFAARLRVLPPPGACRFELVFPRTGQVMLCEAELPRFVQQPVRIEALLAPSPGWSASNLAAHAWCLSLEENLAEMGPARFVDAVFRFALDRWPGRAEAAVHEAALATGRIGAIACFLDILTSREQADRETKLPSPYDADFPFRLVAPGADGES